MYRSFFKRYFDCAVAAIALALFSPLMAVVAILIKLEDGGDILFRQIRVGKNGEEFKCFKFRSMAMHAENLPSGEAANMPITRIGRLIRRTSIDELPQLFSVLRGDMSIVGPRPPVPSQVGLCSLRQRNGSIKCLPGMTGLAQINGYNGMPDLEKAEFDGEYARKMSLATDLKIILRTFSYFFREPPVY